VTTEDRDRGAPQIGGERRRELGPRDPADAVGAEQPAHRAAPYPVTRKPSARRIGSWEHRPMSDDLVQVWSTGDPMLAELTKAKLEDEGIDVLVKSSMGGSSAYPVGPSYLFVRQDQEADARRVLAAIEAGDYAIDDDDDVGTEAPP
jgi:hypothetical protein